MFYAAWTVRAAFQSIATQSGTLFTTSEKDIEAAIEACFGPRLELLEDPRLKEELIQRNTRLQANPNRVELAKRVLTEYDPNLAGEPDPVGKLKLLLLDARSVAVLKKLQTAFEKAGVTP